METGYCYETKNKPVISFLTAIASAGLAWGAISTEGAPLFIRLLMWAIAALFLLVALGAFIGSSVRVGKDGSISISKSLASFRFSDIHLAAADVVAVELQRRMTPGFERANDTGGSSPNRPRFNLVLRHRNGSCLIEAASRDLGADASRLARALGCPVEKTGDWKS